MTRLIDADALKIEIACLHGADYQTIHYLNHAPTVDAVPVRHGKWIDEGYYADNTNIKAWHCSECNWHMLGYEEDLFRYCPMCGSRMGEDEIN